ncbi:MAG: 16S rRNA (uracil(1498)-N(3))-methyltransferase [Planctomycetes bacterium]|nr:16S rRNA (uracil(1498)-N(3))-methyltransferase [Planctomycetota bacterium]MCB9887320.1 16S rRNA (uracil(1498)-N(3))-methyltransferase [Planctomycetota bacterium]
MNFLLLEPGELDEGGVARLVGRRAAHVQAVLGAAVGDTLRAGLLDGPLGNAVIEAVGDDAVVVRASWERQPPASADVLMLAVPRPKVLLRMLAHAAAFGFAEIVLFRSWRVDKSHLDSTAMSAQAQREQLLLGLEQAGRTQLPKVRFCPLFKPMVEDDLPTWSLPRARFVGHPTAPTQTAELELGAAAPFALCLGPDGGLLPYEVERLAGAGFLPVSCGPHALRTEAALSLLFGQLDLLRRRASLRR